MTFGTLLIGQQFWYRGILWKRLKGVWGIPVHDIGTGQVGWPFTRKTMVNHVHPCSIPRHPQKTCR